MDEKNEIYIDLDFYIDGIFKIDKTSTKHFALTSDSNLISLGTNNYFALDLRVVRW